MMIASTAEVNVLLHCGMSTLALVCRQWDCLVGSPSSTLWHSITVDLLDEGSVELCNVDTCLRRRLGPATRSARIENADVRSALQSL